MYKKLAFGEDARNRLKAGVDKLAAAVTTTLGLKGRNVAIGRGWVDPQVVHDGVTVAKQIILEDPFENIGAQIVREAAAKTNDNVGDGTTTATLLAQQIVEKALKVISSGANAMMLKRGLEKAMDRVIKDLQSQAIPVKTKIQRQQVATVSSQDEYLGKIIADAYQKVGDSGVVTFTESRGFETEVEVKSGSQLPTGYASPYFMTDPTTQEAVIEDASILVLDMKMSAPNDVLLALNNITKKNKNIVIIGEVEGDALVTLLYNRQQGKLLPLVIKPPFVATRQREALEDLAILTGARLVSEDLGRTFDSILPEDLGHVDKVIAGKNSSVLVGGAGDGDLIKKRAELIKEEIENSKGMEKERLQQRLSVFSGRVAVIKVGASTEGEMAEKKLRVEDAINATKAAIEGGIVAGGGVALLQARESIKDLDLKGDEEIGANILYDILDRPLRKIVENAGMEGIEVISNLKEKDKGFNILTMAYGDMFELGITDPTNVPISALTNAVSVAILIFTTDCVVVPSEIDQWSPEQALKQAK